MLKVELVKYRLLKCYLKDKGNSVDNEYFMKMTLFICNIFHIHKKKVNLLQRAWTLVFYWNDKTF